MSNNIQERELYLQTKYNDHKATMEIIVFVAALALASYDFLDAFYLHRGNVQLGGIICRLIPLTMLLIIVPLFKAFKVKNYKVRYIVYSVVAIMLVVSMAGHMYFNMCSERNMQSFYAAAFCSLIVTLMVVGFSGSVVGSAISYSIVTLTVIGCYPMYADPMDGITAMSLVIITNICQFICVVKYDKTYRHSYELKCALEYRSCHDELTGLYSRHILSSLCNASSEFSEEYWTILMLDIDYFKHVNDTYGHAHGDKILKRLATCLEQSIRPDDVCLRYGGEEFIVLLNKSDENGGIAVAKRITGAFCKANEEDEFGCHPTLSIGVHEIKKRHENYRYSIHCADEILYTIKQNGRNGIGVIDANNPKIVIKADPFVNKKTLYNKVTMNKKS